MYMPRYLPNSQISQWATNADKKIDLPSRGGPGDGWVQYINDSLGSMSTLTAGSAGSWTANGTVLTATLAAGSAQMRLVSNTITPTSPINAYVVEVEVETPTNFATTNDHIGIGLQNGAVDQTGRWVGIIRGDSQIGFLQDTIGWAGLAAYTKPSAGTWFKYRVLIHVGTVMRVYLDGTERSSTTATSAFTAGSTKPMIMWYNDTGSTTVRFRNLKAWYQVGTTFTSLPA
jgi:hypothetical protein